MIRRLPVMLVLTATLTMLLAACNGAATGPALTDPTAIVTAALTATESAKSVHLDITVDGKATVALPVAGSTGTPLDVTGTTASADVDLANHAARATFLVPAMLNLAGEVIAVDGKSYVKSTLTGPLYQESGSGAMPVDPGNAGAMIDNLGDLLLKAGVNLTKGDDVACGSKSCYTVTADLTAADLGTNGAAVSGLPVDLAGATLRLTVRVEKDLPYHLAGVTAILSMPAQGNLTMDITASKWDEPVSISAPPADKVKPAGS